ncbi:DUF1330 domain-containing protein [Algoriphagus machipongonensis]|uniref:DUF1330 domain-containing protein n=1 Tax=Algoriphagus machipongonensis TaxID=388413 RepID=A3HSQ9_9BACT|nr:DUF1330 domain-containing protein [Algoriphagus machipongonensis]EAZ82877.1 hypothetical protein ALPR1_11690 [Algoriphagus machipongonensis]
MPAYVLVEVDIHDQDIYEEYKKHTPESIAEYGGKFIIRGNPIQVLEGEWNHDRLVMLEFKDRETAEKWYYSEKYTKAREIRSKGSKANFFIVDLK